MRPRVTLVDGPLAGEVVEYYSPLPEVLVVCDKSTGRWHDYVRAEANHYRHAGCCTCTRPIQRPVNLDEEFEISHMRY